MVHDRQEATERLAKQLSAYKGRPLVLAIPRCAVPMGKQIAEEQQGDIDSDVVRVRKLRAPADAVVCLETPA